MPFYIDIAHPARDKALKKIRAQTEAEMDPMGFTATPRAPRAWEPDIPTPQVPLAPGVGRPMSQAEMLDAARTSVYQQPAPGSVAERYGMQPRTSLMPAEEMQAIKARGAEAEAGFDLEAQRAAFMEQQAQYQTEYPDEFLPWGAEPGAGIPKRWDQPALAAELDPMERQQFFRTKEQRGESAIALAGKAPAGLGIPEFMSSVEPRPRFATEDIGIKPSRAGGGALKLAEKVIEPFEVGAETLAELVSGKMPTIVKDGWTATVKDHRQRSIKQQIGLGIIFDPFIVAKAFTIPIKATRAVVRSSIRSQLKQAIPDIAERELDDAVEEIARQYEQKDLSPSEYQAATRGQNPLGNFDDPDLSFGADELAMANRDPNMVYRYDPDLPPEEARAAVPEPAEAQKIRIKILEDEPRVKVVEDKPLSGPLPENGPPVAPISGTHRVYHGTDQVFDAFDEGAQSVNALYGPGVYTTEDAAVASGYAMGSGPKVRILEEGAEAREKVGNVWSMDIRVNKFLDMDAPPDKQLLDELRSDVKDYIDEWSDDLWPLPQNVRSVNLDNLQTNDDLYQQLVIFHGDKFNVNDLLIHRGYDTITHVGGARTGTKPHRVWVSLDSETISPAFGKNKPSAAAMVDAPAAAAPSPAAVPEEVVGPRWVGEGDRLKLENAPPGTVLTADDLFDIRNVAKPGRKDNWKAFYKGTDEEVALSTLGRARYIRNRASLDNAAEVWAARMTESLAQQATPSPAAAAPPPAAGVPERTVGSYVTNDAARFYLAGDDLEGVPTKLKQLTDTKISDLSIDDLNDALVEAYGSIGSTSSGVRSVSDRLVTALTDEGVRRGYGRQSQPGALGFRYIEAPSPAAALEEIRGTGFAADLSPLSAADEVVAPRFVETSKPRYRDATPEFDSPLDKALYIVADSARRSKRDPEILRFAMDATGLSEAAVRSAGDNIRTVMKNFYDEGADTFRVPRQYDAARVAREVVEEAPTPSPIPPPVSAAVPGENIAQRVERLLPGPAGEAGVRKVAGVPLKQFNDGQKMNIQHGAMALLKAKDEGITVTPEAARNAAKYLGVDLPENIDDALEVLRREFDLSPEARADLWEQRFPSARPRAEPTPSPAQVAAPSSPSRLQISQVLSKNDVVITEGRGGWNARVERRKPNDSASYSLVSGAESEEVAKRQAYDRLQAENSGGGGGPSRPVEDALGDAVDPEDAAELYPEIPAMLAKAEPIRDMDRPAMVGRFLDSIPGISDTVDWVRPANTMNEDIMLAQVAKTGTRAMLNSESTYFRQFQLYPVLREAFGPNALNGKPIEQMVFIGTADQVVPWNKTLFDIAQRPDLYQLDEAQKNALAIWARHQEELTTRVADGFGVKLRNFEVPEGAVFLSSVDINDDLLKQLDTNEYRQVQKGRGQTRVHESAADRWLSNLEQAVTDAQKQSQDILNRDLTPEEIFKLREKLKADVKFKALTDIEILQSGMDIWKNNSAARQVFKEGSGGRTYAEALESIINPITGKPKYQGLIDARKATIRQIANLRNRIEKYRVPTGAIDPETGKPIYIQQPSAKGGQKARQNLAKAETKSIQIARRIDAIQNEIDKAGDAARAGGDKSASNGDVYGPQFSYLHGQLHELNIALTKAFKDASTYQEFVGDKATEGVAMMDELQRLLHQLYGNPAGKNQAEKIGIKGRYDAIGVENEGWILVKEGGLYRYYKGDDAKHVRSLVTMDESRFLALMEDWRGTAFAADFSPLFGVQLPLATLANPKGVAKNLIGAGKESWKYKDVLRIFRTQNMAKVISEDFTGYMDMAFYTGREVIADTPTEFAGGLLGKIPFGIGPKFLRGNEAMYSVILRQAKGLYDEGIKDLLKAGATPEQAKAVAADASNKVVPMWSPGRLGISPKKEQLFRALPTSISFLTKPVELLATATSGFLKLPIPGATLSFQERLAIKWVTRMAAAYMTASISSQVLATMYTDTDKSPWQAAKDAAMPGSGTAGKIQFGSYYLPIGGPYRGIIEALVPRDVPGVPFPVPFAGLWRWANNRKGPAVSQAIDQIRNEDFYGAAIVPKDAGIGEIIGRRAAYGIEGISPLSVGSVVGNIRRGLGNVEDFGNQIDWSEVVEDFTSQLAGNNMSKESPYTTSDHTASKWAKDNGIKQYNGDEVKRTRDLPPGALEQFREQRPDLKERIDEEVEKAASLGIEWAVNTHRAMQLKVEAAGNQQLADDKLDDFWLDQAISGAMNPSEWREERRNRMLTLAAGRREIYGDFPEKDEKDKTPTDRYYEEFDRIRTTVGRGLMTADAWDEMERWIADQTPKDRAWIETNTGLGNLTPMVKEYHEDMKKLEGYWQIEDNYFATQMIHPEARFLWEQYKNATKSQKQSGMYSDLRDIEEELTGLRQEYRWKHKDVDGILAKWDYSGVPVHEDNYDRWVRMPVLLDFHFREAESEPKLTPPPAQPALQPSAPSTGRSTRDALLGTDQNRTPMPTQVITSTPNTSMNIKELLAR